jgi:hypothetical protein
MLFWPRLVCGRTAYQEAHLVHVFPSCLGASEWRPGALLISPFNVKWRFSALARDVEGSKLCLFSVIIPAKCVSSVSPRFHYRRLAFCFLPLAAILESTSLSIIKDNLVDTVIYVGSYFLSGLKMNCSMSFLLLEFLLRNLLF